MPTGAPAQAEQAAATKLDKDVDALLDATDLVPESIGPYPQKRESISATPPFCVTICPKKAP